MNNKINSIISCKPSRLCLKATVLTALLPTAALAQTYDVTGIWDVTVLTRTDLVPLRQTGVIPEHTVKVADDTYQFNNDGSFTTTDIDGRWSMYKSQYGIATSAYDLENQFRDNLVQNEPGIIINSLKLLSRKMLGNQLDNGIWGTEKFEYKIDSSLNGYRDVVKLSYTTNVAGKLQVASAAAMKPSSVAGAVPQATSQPKRGGAMDAAVDTLLQHLRNQGRPAQ